MKSIDEAVSGIATEWLDKDTFARFEVDGVEEWVPVYIELLGGNRAELFPFIPRNIWQVNRVASSCKRRRTVRYPPSNVPPFPVFIESVNEAQGTLDGMIDDVDALLDTLSSIFGLNVEDLIDNAPDWGADDPFVGMLAANLQLLSCAGPGSVRSALEHGIAWDGEPYPIDEGGIKLAEALLDATGVAEKLRQLIDDLQDAPDDPGSYSITAISKAATGPRHPDKNPPPRETTVEIVVGGLEISPLVGCVEVGDTIQFRAVVGGKLADPADYDFRIMSPSGPGHLDESGKFCITRKGARCRHIRTDRPAREKLQKIAETLLRTTASIRRSCMIYMVN